MPSRFKYRRGKLLKLNQVCCARPTIWGNPYIIGRDGDRETVIRKYREHLSKDKDLQSLMKQKLKGLDLGCFCNLNEDCHVDIILQIANSEEYL